MFNEEFIEDLLPVELRKPKMIAWLTNICKSERNIFEIFELFRLRVNECRRYSSQTLSLEAFLRLKFNNNGINIVNSFSDFDIILIYWLFENQQFEFDYWLEETEDEGFPNSYWLEEEANITLYYDFIVEVPFILISKEDEIKSYLNKIKLAGKRYKIIYY